MIGYAMVGASDLQRFSDYYYAVLTPLGNGGTDEGTPGPRPADGTIYYAYARDPDGNKICAFCANAK